MPGIGVFVCDCGPNIAGAVDVDRVTQSASDLPGVTWAGRVPLLCSGDGKEFLKAQIGALGLERVVLAACSPREHEQTFRTACREAGLNPFLLQVANLREQCAWVSTDRESATRKAETLVRGAVARVAQHDPLETPRLAVDGSVVVIGAGVAGMEAALMLAQQGRQVYVVEKAPSVGGQANRFEEVFPGMECGSCMLEPKLDKLLHNPNITVLTNAQVVDVVGFFGNYTVEVLRKARYVDVEGCYGCDGCVEACPVTGLPDEYNSALGTRRALHFTYPGALPNAPVLDTRHCLRFQGEECSACAEACPFGAINYEQQDERIELKVGGVVLAPGFAQFDARKLPNLGYGRYPDVYTSLEFEYLLSSGGPTKGELVTRDGRTPRAVAFIHCVGSRTPGHVEYCSGTCCQYTMKFAHMARKKLPDARLFDIHAHLALPGKGAMGLYQQVKEEGVRFLRTDLPAGVQVTPAQGGYHLAVPGHAAPIFTDMVVLSTAMVPPEDTTGLAELFGVTLDPFGYFQEEHGRLDAVSSNIEGIQIAGAARGPADIQGATIQGAAAAGKLLHKLVPGEEVELEAITAWSDPDLCGGCKMCLSVCPYRAVTQDAEKNISVVNEALCRGCGTCAAACPGGAMQSRHFAGRQLFAEIEGLMR
jgi:heterodisulfide reductase subunit A